MRTRAYWWGFIFIPETDSDMKVLQKINDFPEFETSYDGGGNAWITEFKEFNGSANPETPLEFPLGKALTLNR